jgi:poly-gamma-glutamate synthesis protein (capsule biosynthesis protein)
MVCSAITGCVPSASTVAPPTPRTPSTAAATISAPTLTPTPAIQPVAFSPALPADIRPAIQLPSGYTPAADGQSALIQFSLVDRASHAYRVYLLAAPYFTVRDQISLPDLKNLWHGSDPKLQILVNSQTRAVFEARWGAAGASVQTVDSTQSLQLEPNDPSKLVLLPFEEVDPRWKILKIDGVTPFSHSFDPSKYGLAVFFGFSGINPIPAELTKIEESIQPNYDPNLLSIVAMTGTTALVRATAYKMSVHGIDWPGEDIVPYLKDADITHISNEVSFYDGCSKGNPNDHAMMFCTPPEYLGLLTYVGADVIELTGNHNLDYGRPPYKNSFELYKQAGMKTYAGGMNEEEARAPLLLEDHGNKIAFMGCNFVGPGYAMATKTSMGAAHCDFPWFEAKIKELRSQGYLPIFTFQYGEYFIHKPGEHQERDYRAIADAGAVVVSGSQAHYPQVMSIYNDSFIHYGLGNLFFDQMDRPVKGTREEFIDRHYFYNGRYINTELVTALLEDYARPRPMTPDERADFLTRIFTDALPASKSTPTPAP